ncbi:hypothetical protein GCD22_01596 [Acidithiobacillus thiooxidans ATCC 19377]|uniref:Uncharacterized protein n=1 Tax=Acidithiobacillus thiooxidans ATCC 19377 TaxID=637390 RepID=A0A5P9XQK3_ACITH|nr:hypothetical protein GCD22_01596 [Acidithiobacillus thiooxidans ATCC 19377]
MGSRVRINEYALKGIPDAKPVYRLITRWLGPIEAPALELDENRHRFQPSP